MKENFKPPPSHDPGLLTNLFSFKIELSFPENAIITNLEFPDEDWWFGSYNGATGLFPANYVTLNE